jgi:putative redox protein
MNGGQVPDLAGRSSPVEGANVGSRVVEVSTVMRSGYLVDASARNFRWTIDEPEATGGTDSAPNPIEQLAGALGACTIATIAMYLDRKGWVAERLAADVTVDWRANPPTVHRVIECTGRFDAEQRTRIARVADACPVHKLLANASTVTTEWR